ncbi:MAG: enoyl-CoA hydratase-related protein [Thermoanaerobaculia bacterium]
MKQILTESSDGIGTITLNRPEKLNALVGTMREELRDAIEAMGRDRDARAIIITGAGRGFCAGGDVETMFDLQRQKSEKRFEELLESGRRVVAAIRESPKIVIAAVNGVAAGAGCNLALACDYRIASEEAKLGETFVRIGLHPDWGGTWFLPRIIGPSRALEMMASGRMVDAAEALSIGLVDRVVPPDVLRGESRRLASAIGAGPAEVIAEIKKAVEASRGSTLDEQIDMEKRHQRRAFLSADAEEGMRAFFEKRPPRFGES